MSRQQHHLMEGERAARVSVRMPERLKRAIARLALDEGRSENALMVEALRQYVETRNAAKSGD
jgi:predicted transcriptional regulator